jgi:hypothetical protein
MAVGLVLKFAIAAYRVVAPTAGAVLMVSSADELIDQYNMLAPEAIQVKDISQFVDRLRTDLKETLGAGTTAGNMLELLGLSDWKTGDPQRDAELAKSKVEEVMRSTKALAEGQSTTAPTLSGSAPGRVVVQGTPVPGTGGPRGSFILDPRQMRELLEDTGLSLEECCRFVKLLKALQKTPPLTASLEYYASYTRG